MAIAVMYQLAKSPTSKTSWAENAKRTCARFINVPLPSKPKTCSSCGVDLSNVSCTKDEQGNLYCQVCWGCEIGSSQGWSGSQ